jgi:hypothetical protein
VTSREERVAANEALFREVNERIAELGVNLGSGSSAVVCECGAGECAERLELSQTDYARLRSSNTRFAVVPGHERRDVETVLEEREGYLVIEKVGVGATIAERQAEGG